ncbi:MAG TPA: DNA polymerase I [Bryobacteraceae bacterium]|nr:DNA polymerase I [Bryobacteraceae bacterium]
MRVAVLRYDGRIMPAQQRPKLFLIDTFGFIFRAYHARARSGAPPMRTTTGISTEAVYIFHNMLKKLLQSYKPEYISAIWESSAPTFRSEAYTEYKANRTEMPEDLAAQITYVRKLLDALRIPILQYPGFEADDVIGTIARRAEESGEVEVIIVSSDKDMLQLVTDRVSMLNPMKDDIVYDPAKTEAFMGVPPSSVADLLALKGDSIDNIPGAPGIGDKGARDLIARFGTVENAIERAAEVERKMYRESLQNHKDQILMSKKLATIDTQTPVEWCLASLTAQEPDVPVLKTIYRELEFFSHLKELGPTESNEDKDYRTLLTAEEVDAFVAEIPTSVPVAVAAVETGIGVAYKAGHARGVPFELAAPIFRLIADPGREKITHDIKIIAGVLEQHGIRAANLRHDVMLYAFLLSADPSSCGCEVLAEKYLDRKLGTSADMRADCALEIYLKLIPEITERFTKVYEEIDLPLTEVLRQMECAGIRVDPAQLGLLSQRMDVEIARLTGQIHEISGFPFNINSPQQLAKVLFEDLKLPSPVKYGKGKTTSTAADVLEALAAEHEIARLVLEYRQLSKLKGTYVDALPALIRPDTGRVHTTFNQTGAATGRLSSSNPNLQNIPIRTELGREIRAAFVPREGWVLVVADYSQIELRLLAHMSMDALLVKSFRAGEDIHTRTAAEVFGVGPLMVTPDMRRNAKAVNFGIVYGQTPFGLAASLGIDRKEAETYIRQYFERYSGVKNFIAKTIEEVRRTGVAKTLVGRERPIPDMNTRNPNARSFAERTAVNTPLQGTAADLIKMAMIRIDRELQRRGSQARMLLQVHDELVLEAPPDEVPELKQFVKREMENVYDLEVPLIVDVGVGSNWRDAK